MAAVFDQTADSMSSIIKRAILVIEIPYITDNVDDLKDKLTIYFGKTSNGGGSVEQVITPFGGSLRNALVFFETVSVVTSVLRLRHELEGGTVKVQTLPPVFAKIQGTIEPFYSDALSRQASETIVAQLSTQFGAGDAVLEKGKLTNVSGSMDFLQEVKRMIYRALFKVDSLFLNEDIACLVDKSVKITDVPYITDDIEQLKEELDVFFRHKRHIKPDKVICPVGGNMKQAVVVFRNSTDRNQFLSSTPHIMFNEHMVVEEIPQVFCTVTAAVDQFYPRTSSKGKWNKIQDIIQKQFNSKITKHGIEISGTLDEIMEVGVLILGAAGIPESATIHNDVADESQGRKNTESRTRSELPTAPMFIGTTKTSYSKPNKLETPGAAGTDSDYHQKDRLVDQTPVSSSTKLKSSNSDIDRDSVNIVDDHYGHPSTTNSSPNMPESKTYTQSAGKEQAGGATHHTDDGAAVKGKTRKKSIQSTTSTGSEESENAFITIDTVIFRYIEERFKKEIKGLEKMFNVKMKSHPADHEDTDLLYLEVQARKKISKSVKQPDIAAAKEEFNTLVEDSNIKKEVLAFKNLSKKEAKKVEDRLKKYPHMICRWDDNGCTLCDEDTVVDAAAEELRNTLFGYESMTVDKIGFQYLSYVHKDQVDGIKMKYSITMDVQTIATDECQQAVYVKPIRKKKCSLENLSNAKEEFITLYQQIYLSTRKTAVKCPGISEDVIKETVRLTKEKFPKLCYAKGTTSEEVILCAEESIHDSAVREFRTRVGLAPKRKLKKTQPGNKKEMMQIQNPNIEDTGYKKKPTLPSEFVTREGLSIRVITDDLVKQTTDVIVNTANCTLSFDGGVSKAISTAAGPELQKECKAILHGRYLSVGECLSSNSFNLSCKRIIHVVGPRYENEYQIFGSDLQRTISNVLWHNESVLCQRSIALPLISSGNLGGPKKYCAKVLAIALEDFSTNTLHSERHLKEVVLVNIDAEITKIIQEVFAEVFDSPENSPSGIVADENRGKPQKTSGRIHQFKSNRGIDLFIVNDDITRAKVDVVVNAANKRLRHGRGVAGALSKAAGKELQKECDMVMSTRPSLKTGELVMTSGYNLKARILHIVGPIYQDYSSDKEFYQTLKETFTAAIRYANIPIEAKSIAVPLVSSGIYGGPKQMCADALLEAIKEFDKERNIVLEKIVLINLDMEATQALYGAFSQHTECQDSISVSDILTENSAMKRSSLKGRQTRRRDGDSEHQASSTQFSNDPEYYKNNVTYHNDDQRLPGGGFVDDQSEHGAKSGSWSMVTKEEVTDSQPSQESGFLTEYVFKPFTNLFFGGAESDDQVMANERNNYSSSSTAHASYTHITTKSKSENSSYKEKILNSKRKCQHPHRETDTQLLHCCNQTICAGCITDKILQHGKCFICDSLYGIVEDPTMEGKMTYYSRSNLTLPGEENGAIEMLFQFPPGSIPPSKRNKTTRRYDGNDYLAYLPYTQEGREMLYLLRAAFRKSLLFVIAKNKTDSLAVIVSGRIPLKLNLRGGIENDGYPDPEYLPKVKRALRKNGIVSSMTSDV